MAKPRNTTLTAARSSLRAANATWNRHIKMCHPCNVAHYTKDYGRCCEAGWSMAKTVQSAKTTLEMTEALDSFDVHSSHLGLW